MEGLSLDLEDSMSPFVGRCGARRSFQQDKQWAQEETQRQIDRGYGIKDGKWQQDMAVGSLSTKAAGH